MGLSCHPYQELTSFVQPAVEQLTGKLSIRLQGTIKGRNTLAQQNQESSALFMVNTA